MSIGQSLICAMIDASSRTAFRQVRREYFTSDEVHAYDFLASYHQQHGGFPTLAAFQENGIILTPATGNFSYHLQQIRDRAVYNTIRVHHDPLMRAIEARDMTQAVAVVEQMRAGVQGVRVVDTMQTLQQGAQDVLTAYREAHTNPQSVGVTLGSPTLNALTAGAQPGDVVTFVSRPNVGKSYSLANVALAAWEAGHSVLFVTLEMTMLQIARRVVGMKARIDPDKLRRGTLSQRGEHIVQETIRAIDGSGCPFHLAGGAIKKTVPELDSMVQEHQPDLVVVDASYLLQSDQKYKSKTELLGDVGQSIKDLAQMRGVPIVNSVQLNRKSNDKSKHDPDLGMIYGTDVTGQLASIVVAVRKGKPPYEDTRRRYNLAKNREGELGKWETNWLFSPLNFDEVVAQDTRDAGTDTGWML